MTWLELAKMQQYAAEYLIEERDDRLYRASCTRAYYSAYAAITERIPLGTIFAHGWLNPPHGALPGHIDQIAGLSESRKDTIRVALARLRQHREDADYRPWIEMNPATARESWRDLATILVLLP